MAIGMKAKEIVQRTTTPPKLELKAAPGANGRLPLQNYEKVTVYLHPSQVLFLNKIALAIRKQIGLKVSRPELIRGLVDYAKVGFDPARKDFGMMVHKLLVG